jgi:lipase
VRLHAHEWGDPKAPLVVCLHGVQAHGRRFRRLAEERLAARFHVVAPDLRGHGRSTWDEPWTLAAHVDDILDTVEGPGRWIGHSFGGRLVAEVMCSRPDLVERAVLLDPALVVPADYAALLAEQELAADESFASPEEAVEATVAGLARRSPEALAEEVREHLVEGDDGRFRFRYSPQAVAAGYLVMADLPPPWWRTSIPTLIVAAIESKFVAVGEVAAYTQGMGDRLKVEVVPGGHSVLWEAFEETAAAIDAFLES